MQQSSKNVLKAVVLLVVILVGYRLLFPPQPGDEQQIRDQLAGVVAAAQSRDVSGIMKPISQHFVDSNGYNQDQLHLMLARNIHYYNTITVTPSNLTVSITGDTAHTDEYVTVTGQGDGAASFSYHGQVGLEWKKEPANRLLFIPTQEWHIVKSDQALVTDY